jgi:peptide/nickel transport system ATP-binding protein
MVEIDAVEAIIGRSRHPYTQALIASTLDLDGRVREHNLKGIQGAPPDLRFPPPGCRFHPRCQHVMDICSQQEPPNIGSEDRFAACWWVKEQAEKVGAD